MKYLLAIGMFCGAALFAGVEGTYILDKDTMLGSIDKIIEMQVNNAPAEQREMARAQGEGMKPMMTGMIQTLSIEIELKSGGIVSFTAVGPDGQSDTGTGTWVRDGDKFTFKKDGEEETIDGTLKGENIHLQIPNMPMEIVLKKK